MKTKTPKKRVPKKTKVVKPKPKSVTITYTDEELYKLFFTDPLHVHTVHALKVKIMDKLLKGTK